MESFIILFGIATLCEYVYYFRLGLNHLLTLRLLAVVDPRVQTLDVEVLDTAKDDKTIGTLSVPIRSLLDAHDLILERPYFLDVNGATSEMTVSLRLCLRVSLVA